MSEATELFNQALEKMMALCEKHPECKNILVNRLFHKKRDEAVDALEEVIVMRKSMMEVDEQDSDIKDYRLMQENISLGKYKEVINKIQKMDTSPRDYIPFEVDNWLSGCVNLSL